MSSSVKVAVRVRPLNARERKRTSKVIVKMSGSKVQLIDVIGRQSSGGMGPAVQDNREFSFDYCYWSIDSMHSNAATQADIYKDLGTGLLSSAVSGYNACALAYGQTGAGKTHTMMGTEDNPGIIPRLSMALFDYIASAKAPNVSYRTEISYAEIYNEKIGDLLSCGERKKVEHTLKVREHPVYGPHIPNLTWHEVSDYEQLLSFMRRGNAMRATAATLMNDMSSRSHAIFSISFTQACFSANTPSETTSCINLVDLAGSERAKASGATGVRLKEGSQINKSLVALGNVISALADLSNMKQKKVHIPYRDSTLTWLLKDSLGGNSETVMVAAISPAHHNYNETLSTLRYASRAKDIVNKPVINEDENVKLIRELREEIGRLRSLLATRPDWGGDTGLSTPGKVVVEQLKRNELLAEELTQEWAGRWEARPVLAQGQEVEVKGEGVSVVLDAEVPHLVALSNDVTSTGITLYYLKEGVTILSSEPSEEAKVDVELMSVNGASLHCQIINMNGKVTLQPSHGQCFINGILVQTPVRLHQGQILLVGGNNIFRFNHPAEAAQLRESREQVMHSSWPSHVIHSSKSLEGMPWPMAGKGSSKSRSG